MKTFILVALAAVLLVAVSGCGHRAGSHSETGTPRVEAPVVAVDTVPMTDTVTAVADSVVAEKKEPAYIPVRRRWRNLDASVHYGETPTEEEIKGLKRDFGRVNKRDSTWRSEVQLYHDMDHYMAVQDLICLYQDCQKQDRLPDDREVLWRLDQFDSKVREKPALGFGRVQFIRGQYERLLDYESGINYEMSWRMALSVELHELYGRCLEKEILALAEGREAELAEALKEEYRLEHLYYDAASERFEKAVGDSSGNMYYYYWDCYKVEILDIGIVAKEEFLHSLYDSTYVVRFASSKASARQIYDAYTSSCTSATDYRYPVEEKIAVTNKERDAIFAWMNARNAVTIHLPGNDGITYESMSNKIWRAKLDMLGKSHSL